MLLHQLDTLRALQDQAATTHSRAGRLLPSSHPTRPATDLPMDSPSSMDMAGTRHTLPPAVLVVIRPMDSRRHVIRAEPDVRGVGGVVDVEALIVSIIISPLFLRLSNIIREVCMEIS